MRKKSVFLIGLVGIAATIVSIALVGSSSGASPIAPAPRTASTMPRAITQTSLENHFFALPGCRIVDTRTGGGPIGNGSTRAFYVGGTFGFAPQGGTSGGCGIPTSAVAIAATVTAVTPGADGFLKAWPSLLTEPAHATVLTYVGNQGTGTTQSISATSGTALKVRNFGSAVNVAIDVSGYYTSPIEGLVYTGNSTADGSGYVYSGSPHLLSVTWISTGIADVTIDRDVTYCTPIAGGYYDNSYYANAKTFNTNKVRVYTWFLDPGTHVPTPVNNYVYLTVTC
jgi:hypothetical protein